MKQHDRSRPVNAPIWVRMGNLVQQHSELGRWQIGILFVCSIGFVALPIFSVQMLSINDYYNHLGRTFVLLHYRDYSTLSEFFLPNWELLPNLAFDSWMVVFGHYLPIEIAGKLFVLTTIALVLSGVVLLHRALFCRWSLWPFLALVFLHNRLLLVGLLNFLFGIGLWLHALALWVYCKRRAGNMVRLAALGCAALVIYFVHLFALGILAVTIAVYELYVFWSAKQPWSRKAGELVAAASAFIPAILVLAYLSPEGGGLTVIRYREFSTRLAAFAVPLLYHPRLETIGFVVLVAVIGWAAATKALKFNRPVIAGVVVLFFLQLLMPNVIGTAEGADHRIPIAMMLLTIAAIDLRPAPRSQAISIALAGGAIFAFHVATLEVRWVQDQPIYADAAAGLSSIPPGARVATALPPDSFDDFSAPAIALAYIPVWEVLSRGGFTQSVFAYPTQHPLVLTPKYAAIAAAAPPDEIWHDFVLTSASTACQPNPDLVAALAEYDYVAFVDRAAFRICDTALFKLFYAGRHVRIYRLRSQS
jgi:hypothetical protein